MALLSSIFFSLAAAHATYWLIHKKRINPIRAASLTTLIFIAISAIIPGVFLIQYQVAFFGGTFVAMSEPFRLGEKNVLFAAIIFGALLFILKKIDFLHFHGGLGGTIGATSFLACLIVYAINRLSSRAN